MKGILSVELTLKGPFKDVRSGLAVLIGNPAWDIVLALATLIDDKGSIIKSYKELYDEFRFKIYQNEQDRSTYTIMTRKYCLTIECIILTESLFPAIIINLCYNCSFLCMPCVLIGELYRRRRVCVNCLLLYARYQAV